MGTCGSSQVVTDVGTAPIDPAQTSVHVGKAAPTLDDQTPDTKPPPDSLITLQSNPGSPPKRISEDGRRGSKTGGGRRLSRRNSTRRRSSAGSEGGVGSWFHWDIFGGKVVDDDMGVPVSEELGLYFEWAVTRVKCYDTHARRAAMKSHRLWKNEYKVRSDTRMTFRVRRFDGVAGELKCGWHIIDGSVIKQRLHLPDLCSNYYCRLELEKSSAQVGELLLWQLVPIQV